jgi:hypothetical protein
MSDLRLSVYPYAYVTQKQSSSWHGEIGPTVDACRANFVKEFTLVIRRAKIKHFPKIQERIDVL